MHRQFGAAFAARGRIEWVRGCPREAGLGRAPRSTRCNVDPTQMLSWAAEGTLFSGSYLFSKRLRDGLVVMQF